MKTRWYVHTENGDTMLYPRNGFDAWLIAWCLGMWCWLKLKPQRIIVWKVEEPKE